MAFDWKGFLKLSWQKALAAAIIFVLILPVGVFFFFFHGTTCIPPVPSMRCGAVNLSEANLFGMWSGMFYWTFTYGFQYYFVELNSWAITVPILLLSYLLACTLVHFFAQKSASRGKKRK